MSEMNITSAQNVADPDDANIISCIKAEIDGDTVVVPLDTANRHYQAILDWVAEGNTIQDAS